VTVRVVAREAPFSFMQRGWHWLAAIGLSLLVVIAFNQPTSLADLASPATWRLPLEPVAALLLITLAAGRIWAWLAAVLLGVMLWLRLGDQLVWAWMGRPFTLIYDLPLGLSLVEIGFAALGAPLTLALVLAAFSVLPLAVWLVWAWQQRLGQAPRALVLGLAALAALALAFGRLDAMPALTSAHGVDQLRLQVERSHALLQARQAWQTANAEDPVMDIPANHLFTRLADKDVVLLFIESVGRSALTLDPFKDRMLGRLRDFAADLDAAGLHAASGWLVSPTIGGQSWLAHATLASGVWTADQPSHRQYMQDAAADLAHLFRRSGHRTVLGMPAIVSPWPEVINLGFEQWYFSTDFGYRGPALEWVTMPDQYTLWALENRERAVPLDQRRPIYLQAALISSHAPFTPDIPVVEPWERLGDGSIVHDLPKDGGAPRDVWRDHPTLLAAYSRSVDYVYETLQSYARRYVDADTLLIMLGDHEPAPRISGTNTERTVPVHIVSGDPALLEPFLAWGFTPGMTPTAASAEYPMTAFRPFLVRAFSGPPPPKV
jgi:hypothetical protein